ncbi:Uncharacterized conserved protein YlxW, UPF0749 family [Kytococcus aerolatus]|uniref:Uncharacterized conserved protein YlxW, UPF0749 family n=1 Tax=Kytococcus aerolatus TaxID=592308 RepID=A0A212T2W4_9MICO|nr:DUF881 domain-containing protein [Kytococcus aerolatus]SNC60190.1 Uncharacterized conserved protein YlxW, UPF0749 family [Kytococcus aerolatus]
MPERRSAVVREGTNPEDLQSSRRPPLFTWGAAPWTVGLLLGLLGFALSVTALDRREDPTQNLTETELVQLLNGVRAQEDALDAERDALLQRKQAYENDRDLSAAQREARERSQELGILAGTLPAGGPGVVLELRPGDDQEDLAPLLLDAVQELRDAGAEAMQVNGHRIVASTWFLDGGSGTVVVDGEELEPPYRLEAIGPADTMRTAMEIPGGVVESGQEAGATVTVAKVGQVTVDATVPARGR